MDMYYQGARIECVEGESFTVTSRAGTVLRASHATVTECEAGIHIRHNGMVIGYRCRGGIEITGVVNPTTR